MRQEKLNGIVKVGSVAVRVVSVVGSVSPIVEISVSIIVVNWGTVSVVVVVVASEVVLR
jgi:hypothetical protein